MGSFENGTMMVDEMLMDAANMMGLIMAAVYAVLLIGWIFQAVLAGSLARQKGYSGAAGFFIALLLPMAGLIYQAGRPVSQEVEDERQRALAGRIAKAIRKSEQPAEKSARAEEDKSPVRRKFKEI